MAGRTLAGNHLSSLANKGRHGDTEIARTSKGELWHVNPQEKSLMSMYGMEGEKMVDAVGSGTINPETGLEEKWIMQAAAVGSLIIGGIGAWMGSKGAKSQGKYDEKTGLAGLQQVQQSKDILEKTTESEKKATFQDYTMSMEDFSSKTGINIEDLEKSTETLIEKSGMRQTAGVTERKSTMWDRIQTGFGLGKNTITATFAKSMGEIEGVYESERARLKGDALKFSNMISLGRERQKSWWA